ncbi:DNA polymerase catalytic subunit [Rhodococcus sp. AW25M09]|uniref:hypothetical protein n=1 Tax=Rhodococcus sp. AW25M09 TaxID=1268303 RepID=UPI0002ABEB1D|nr:hypothetical protein [Rhodococcus sp. AW25M09]CCQ15931.1 DNA polymerase catalytic subunit [Rhodococcus sp. AW25M09]
MAWNAKYNGHLDCSKCGKPIVAGQRVEFVWIEGKRRIDHVHEVGASKKARKWNNGHWEHKTVQARIDRRKRQKPSIESETP